MWDNRIDLNIVFSTNKKITNEQKEKINNAINNYSNCLKKYIDEFIEIENYSNFSRFKEMEKEKETVIVNVYTDYSDLLTVDVIKKENKENINCKTVQYGKEIDKILKRISKSSNNLDIFGVINIPLWKKGKEIIKELNKKYNANLICV